MSVSLNVSSCFDSSYSDCRYTVKSDLFDEIFQLLFDSRLKLNVILYSTCERRRTPLLSSHTIYNQYRCLTIPEVVLYQWCPVLAEVSSLFKKLVVWYSRSWSHHPLLSHFSCVNSSCNIYSDNAMFSLVVRSIGIGLLLPIFDSETIGVKLD